MFKTIKSKILPPFPSIFGSKLFKGYTKAEKISGEWKSLRKKMPLGLTIILVGFLVMCVGASLCFYLDPRVWAPRALVIMLGGFLILVMAGAWYMGLLERSERLVRNIESKIEHLCNVIGVPDYPTSELMTIDECRSHGQGNLHLMAVHQIEFQDEAGLVGAYDFKGGVSKFLGIALTAEIKRQREKLISEQELMDEFGLAKPGGYNQVYGEARQEIQNRK